jgi:Putative regulator of cell autolysis
LRMHLDSPEVNADQGIGVSNVHGRIRLEFGQDFGIKIDSIQGKGTDVTIILPFISDEGGIYENIDRG